MKKKVISVLCAGVLLLGVGGIVSVVSPKTIHSIAHAATAIWQCSKCGYQIRNSGSAPGQMNCSQGGKHVWQRIQ